MKWFRVWHGSATDPKWRTISRRSGQPVAIVYAVWTLMLENASANATERGELDSWDDEVAADAFGLEPGQVTAIRQAMEGLVLCGPCVLNWEKFQPKREDNSAERARSWRERKRTQTNAPDKDTDRDRDSEKKEKEEAPAAPSAEDELLHVLDSEHAKAVVEHRKKLRKPLTPHAAKLLAAKFAGCRDGPNAGADAMIANGWQGFDPAWIENRNGQRSKPSDLDNRRATADAFSEVVAMAEARQRGVGR